MGWAGWESYTPPGEPAAKAKGRSRGARMGAVPCTVTADGTIFTRAEAKANGIVGIHFHSKKEATVWLSLKARAKAGEIHGLQRQVPFILHAHTPEGTEEPVGKIVVDFAYVENGRTVLLEIKGQPRREGLYLWKKKHVQIEYGLSLVEQ